MLKICLSVDYEKPPGGGGVLQISSEGDDQRILGGLKFSIPGFFLGRKIWQVFFCVT